MPSALLRSCCDRHHPGGRVVLDTVPYLKPVASTHVHTENYRTGCGPGDPDSHVPCPRRTSSWTLVTHRYCVFSLIPGPPPPFPILLLQWMCGCERHLRGCSHSLLSEETTSAQVLTEAATLSPSCPDSGSRGMWPREGHLTQTGAMRAVGVGTRVRQSQGAGVGGRDGDVWTLGEVECQLQVGVDLARKGRYCSGFSLATRGVGIGAGRWTFGHSLAHSASARAWGLFLHLLAHRCSQSSM